MLTYVGGARIDALAISGPRHGDLQGKGRPGAESAGSSMFSKKTLKKICVSRPTDLQHPVHA